jgi:hypothetical protein
LTVIAFAEVPNDILLEAEVVIRRDEIYKPRIAAETASDPGLVAKSA